MFNLKCIFVSQLYNYSCSSRSTYYIDCFCMFSMHCIILVRGGHISFSVRSATQLPQPSFSKYQSATQLPQSNFLKPQSATQLSQPNFLNCQSATQLPQARAKAQRNVCNCTFLKTKSATQRLQNVRKSATQHPHFIKELKSTAINYRT